MERFLVSEEALRSNQNRRPLFRSHSQRVQAECAHVVAAARRGFQAKTR